MIRCVFLTILKVFGYYALCVRVSILVLYLIDTDRLYFLYTYILKYQCI